MVINPAAPAQPQNGAPQGQAPAPAPVKPNPAAPAPAAPAQKGIPGMPPIVMQLIEALRTIYAAMKDGGAPPEDVSEMRDIIDRLTALFQKVGQRRMQKQAQPGSAPAQPQGAPMRPQGPAPISRAIPAGSKPGAMPVV